MRTPAQPELRPPRPDRSVAASPKRGSSVAGWPQRWLPVTVTRTPSVTAIAPQIAGIRRRRLAGGAPLPPSLLEAASPPALPMPVMGALFTVARAAGHPPGAGDAGVGWGGGLPISSMRPSATSSRTAITMVTAAVGRPQKTKITAASATAPIRSARRCV